MEGDVYRCVQPRTYNIYIYAYKFYAMYATRMEHRDSSPVFVSTKTVSDRSGMRMGLYSTIFYVTARKRAERKEYGEE